MEGRLLVITMSKRSGVVEGLNGLVVGGVRSKDQAAVSNGIISLFSLSCSLWQRQQRHSPEHSYKLCLLINRKAGHPAVNWINADLSSLLAAFTIHQRSKNILCSLKGIGFLFYQKEFQRLAVQPRCPKPTGAAMQHYTRHSHLSYRNSS